MCTIKLLLNYCILSNLLYLVLSEDYLFEKGTILYRDPVNHIKNSLEIKNVNYIDHHLVPNTAALRVVSTIVNLHEGAIRNLPKLKNLSLPQCKIKEILPGAFQNLPRLKNLHLQDNKVEVIEEGVFNYLNVEYLYLQRNKIHTIRSGALDNMPLLKKIHLNKNLLTKWDSQWFKNTPNLMFLHFRRNQISELPEGAFNNLEISHEKSGLKNTIIYLSKNSISYIHPQAFENVHNLKELWLDRNEIEKIDNEIFAHFTEIEKLCLFRNKITEIGKYAFKELNFMLELNLASNRNLNCLDYEVIVNINKVNIIDDDINCNCFTNLQDKLKENGLARKVKIIHDGCFNETMEE